MSRKRTSDFLSCQIAILTRQLAHCLHKNMLKTRIRKTNKKDKKEFLKCESNEVIISDAALLNN